MSGFIPTSTARDTTITDPAIYPAVSAPYDAILVVSFGGPEGMDDVMPFLENVLRGRNVPRERMIEVSHHYEGFGGVSPINAQNRALIAALEAELKTHGPNLPVYFGNRNWKPFITDALRQMRDDGKKNALAFFTSAYSSYSGCRQYRENIATAREEVGDGAPQVSILRKFYNHPGFIEPNVSNVRAALDALPADRRANARVLFTAHSIPGSMASGAMYEDQLMETSRLVAAGAGATDWKLVYQSRSGPPTQAWLEPDVLDALRHLKDESATDVVVAPIGFISDHMEVLYDLDTEAADLCREIGLNMIRVPTVGTDPRFVAMIRELVVERMNPAEPHAAVGERGPSHDVCPADCCTYTPTRPPVAGGRPTATGGAPASTSGAAGSAVSERGGSR